MAATSAQVQPACSAWMTNPPPPAADQSPANATAAQMNVTVLVMDTFVPVIPEPSADAIEAKFPHKTLTKIEGQPTYADFHLIREEIFRNALSSKSPSGGREAWP